jgi:nucleoside transporter
LGHDPDNTSVDPSTPVLAVATPEPLAVVVPGDQPPSNSGAALRSTVGLKLAATMFLHHFTLGAWIVTLGTFVKSNTGSAGTGMFSPGFVGVVYGAGPLGGMVAPFLTGLLADHFFATERILSVLHLVGAAALVWAVGADSQASFYLAMLAYFVCFIPCFALVSSMTFHHLAEPTRDFPKVRAFSTMGWIAGGVFVGWVWPTVTGDVIEATATPLKIGVVGELVTAAFCLLLPHTPPGNRRVGGQAPSRGISGSQTLDLVRQPRFIALIVLAALAHIPSQFYYAYCNVYLNSWIGMESTAAKMALGQVVEVICMFSLPVLLMRVSVKASILGGLLVWGSRFWMLAAAASPALSGRAVWIYTAILLHGVAFTLVTISLQLEVDRCAGKRQRATAQGVLAVAMQGVGCFIGAELAGRAGAWWLPELERATYDGWYAFWLVPASICGAVFLAAAIMLPGRARQSGNEIGW